MSTTLCKHLNHSYILTDSFAVKAMFGAGIVNTTVWSYYIFDYLLTKKGMQIPFYEGYQGGIEWGVMGLVFSAGLFYGNTNIDIIFAQNKNKNSKVQRQ